MTTTISERGGVAGVDDGPRSKRGRATTILCWRTVAVPVDERDRFLQWIGENAAVRRAHGICAELVLEPTGGEGDTVVLTIWPDHETFDDWITTPERDALTASDVHRSVDYRPITRYDVVCGYADPVAIDVATPTPGRSAP